MMTLTTKSKNVFLTVPLLLFAVGPAASATDFNDRDALVDALTAGTAADIADAEQALAEANQSLTTAQQDLADAQAALTAAEADQVAAEAALTAAQQAKADADAALASAQQALASGLAAQPPLPADQITALETAVANATTARDEAAADLATAQADATAAAAAKTAAQTAVDQGTAAVASAQTAVDQANANLQAAQNQVAETQQFVANLSDRQVVQLNRAFNNAVHNGLLLDLDVDLALLQRIIDEDLSNGQIQQLIHALELQARFAQHAARFEAKAEATGDDKFLDQAARMEERGNTLRERFLARLDAAEAASEAAADAAADEVQQVAKNEAKKAAAEAAREAAKEHGKGKGPN